MTKSWKNSLQDTSQTKKYIYITLTERILHIENNLCIRPHNAIIHLFTDTITTALTITITTTTAITTTITTTFATTITITSYYHILHLELHTAHATPGHENVAFLHRAKLVFKVRFYVHIEHIATDAFDGVCEDSDGDGLRVLHVGQVGEVHRVAQPQPVSGVYVCKLRG